MKLFGILSLLVSLAIGVWWLSQGLESSRNGGVDGTSSYGEVIDGARQAAEQLSTGMSGTVTIYDGITVDRDSERVDLSGRGLSGSLKAEVRQLSNLRELDIGNNQFTDLPAEVGQLQQLEILNLAGNPLTGLPYELGNLANLKVLDLRNTNYASADLEVIRASLPATTQILVE